MEIETLTPTKTSSGDLFEHFKDDPKKIDVISKLPEDFPKQVINNSPTCIEGAGEHYKHAMKNQQ